MQTISLNEEFKDGLYTYTFPDLEKVLHLLLRGFVASHFITNFDEDQREEMMGKLEAILAALEKIDEYAKQVRQVL